MLDKLEAIYSRYCEIEQQMNDPAVTGDMKRYVKLSKDYKDLQPLVKAYHDYTVSRTKITKEQYDSYLNVLGDLDFNGFNSIEQANYRAKCERVNQTIQETGRWIDNK